MFKRLFLSLIIVLICSVGAKAQYCEPTYGNPCFSAFSFDVVDDFYTTGGNTNITNMDTDCTPGTYSYTGLSCSGCPGQEIDMGVKCESVGPPGPFEQGFAIWIDWDESNTFELTEKVMSTPPSLLMQFGSFTIPPATPPGTYRMRVRACFDLDGASIDPCSDWSFGETEDYDVIVELCSPTICEGDTLEIDLSGIIPPGPLTYVWDPSVDISDPFGGPIVDVWPSDTTIYTCTITSPDSTWDVVYEIDVVFPANPFIGLLEDTLCHSLVVGYEIDGTVDVDPSGLTIDWEIDAFIGLGSPTVVYSPDEDNIDPEIIVNTPGIYDFVVYVIDDAGLCPEQTDTIRLTFSEPLHELTSTNPTCFGYTDGTITVTGTGTLPSVEYSIDGGITWQPEATFTDVPAGIHTIISKDAGGCEFSSDIELISPDEIELTLSSDTLICRNGTATLTASATGGVSFTYDWSIPGDDTATQTLSPIDTPTIVTVTAYNELGCSSEEGAIIVTLRDPITLTITENDSICPGFESGATVTAVGGDGAYTYSWTENGSLMGDLTNSITTSPLANTVYCVTVSDGCETTPVLICTETIINPVPVPAFVSDIVAGCSPSIVTFDAILDPTDIAIWTMDGATYTDMPIVSHEFTEVGYYDISLEVTNQYGCIESITISDYIEIVDIPYPKFYINPNPTTIFNTTVGLNAEAEGPGLTYAWDIPGAFPDTSNEEDLSVIYPEGIADTYLVTLVVTNQYGCFNAVEHYVTVIPDVIIYAPNVFTPDGDKYNESWGVYLDGIDIYDFHCTIYNRWGQRVWESFDVAGKWNGTYAGELVQDGTYVWIIEAKESTTDRIREFKGVVTVLR